MMRALTLLVVLTISAACRTTTPRERFGGLWSDDLVRAARYLPADFDACRITTATLLDYIEELSDRRLLSLTARRSATSGEYQHLQITCVGHVAQLPPDHPDRVERTLGIVAAKVGRVGEVDIFHVTGHGGRLSAYQAEVDGLASPPTISTSSATR